MPGQGGSVLTDGAIRDFGLKLEGLRRLVEVPLLQVVQDVHVEAAGAGRRGSKTGRTPRVFAWRAVGVGSNTHAVKPRPHWPRGAGRAGHSRDGDVEIIAGRLPRSGARAPATATERAVHYAAWFRPKPANKRTSPPLAADPPTPLLLSSLPKEGC